LSVDVDGLVDGLARRALQLPGERAPA